MNSGLDTFSIVIPTKFEQDVLGRRKPAIQLNIDATRVSQALTGNEHVQEIIMTEVNGFFARAPVKETISNRCSV